MGIPVKLVVLIKYSGRKALLFESEKPDMAAVLRQIRSDLTALGLPHPKPESVTVSPSGLVSFWWPTYTSNPIYYRWHKKMPLDADESDRLSIASMQLSEYQTKFDSRRPLYSRLSPPPCRAHPYIKREPEEDRISRPFLSPYERRPRSPLRPSRVAAPQDWTTSSISSLSSLGSPTSTSNSVASTSTPIVSTQCQPVVIDIEEQAESFLDQLGRDIGVVKPEPVEISLTDIPENVPGPSRLSHEGGSLCSSKVASPQGPPYKLSSSTLPASCSKDPCTPKQRPASLPMHEKHDAPDSSAEDMLDDSWAPPGLLSSRPQSNDSPTNAENALEFTQKFVQEGLAWREQLAAKMKQIMSMTDSRERSQNIAVLGKQFDEDYQRRIQEEIHKECNSVIANLRSELEVEKRRRIQAEVMLEDFQRECKQPFVVPALMEAFRMVSQVSRKAVEPPA